MNVRLVQDNALNMSASVLTALPALHSGNSEVPRTDIMMPSFTHTSIVVGYSPPSHMDSGCESV